MRSTCYGPTSVVGRGELRHHMMRALPAIAFISLGGCGNATEATRVTLPVIVDGRGSSEVTTNLGYQIELTEARIALRDILFTIAGEVDTTSAFQRLSDALIPMAYAHPGHFQGGDVTGELRGRFAADWIGQDRRQFGMATLIAGTYTAANFTFDRGSVEAGLAQNDPLLGHTARLTGRAVRGNVQVDFAIVVDSPDGRELVGAPFEATVSEGAGELALRFELLDSIEGDTLFDGIDFAGLDEDGDGRVSIEPEVIEVESTYNLFRRTLQTHDHFSVHHTVMTP